MTIDDESRTYISNGDDIILMKNNVNQVTLKPLENNGFGFCQVIINNENVDLGSYSEGNEYILYDNNSQTNQFTIRYTYMY